LLAYFLPVAALGCRAPALAEESPNWKFDFGSGPVAAGYRAVTPETRFSEKSGFGLEGDAPLSAQNGAGPDDLRRDSVGSNVPFGFSARVPEGFYEVTIIFGDAKSATNSTVKAEARRLMLHNVSTKAGEFQSRTFTVAVKRPQLKSGREQGRKTAQSPLDWDDKISLEFNGTRPSVCAVSIAPAEKFSTVFLAGDSTVTNQGYEPFVGWGQVLPRFFGAGAAVYNNADSGETLGSFDASGRLQKIWEAARPGDTLLIQFGHNDQKDKAPNALDTYKTNLKRYISQARERKMIPVLVTPPERRIWKGGELTPTLGTQSDAMREIATQEQVPLIDLNAQSIKLLNALGAEGGKSAFVHFPADTFPGQIKALRDDTHFSLYGGFEMARIVADGVKEQKLEIAKFLVDDLKPFDPSKPDDAQTLALPASPLQLLVKPEGS
jgi:lysophospholipase L1-like esterase